MFKLVLAILIILTIIPWKRLKKSLVQDMKDINIPDACYDCNRGGCHGCALESLTKEQANKVASQITQQAIADGTPYRSRFEKK